MNVKFLVVVQAVLADWATPTLSFSQFPLSPSWEKVRFLGLPLFPIGAQVWIIWRRIVKNRDVSLDGRP